MLIPELSERSTKERTALYLDAELHDRIKTLALENGTSVNRTVLHMIETFLDNQDKTET